MNTEQQIFDYLEEQKLNWTVNKTPLVLPTGTETPFFAAVRSDTEASLGVCRDRYEVFQNAELVELAYRIAEVKGTPLGQSSTFHEGARVSVDISGGNEILEYKNVGDVVEKSFRLLNSHDGSGALSLANWTKVLSCTNGMTRMVKGVGRSIRHTTNMRTLVERALVELELVEEQQHTMFEEIRRMIEVDITADNISEMIDLTLGVDSKKIGKNGQSEEYSTRKVNIAMSLFDSIKEEIEYKGANVWGLVSGITHFTTHKMGGDKRRESSKVFGSGARMDNAAYERGLELVRA